MPNIIAVAPLETIISTIIVIIFALVCTVISVRSHVKQARCKHAGGVNETSACEAICRQCGKNLGWIGNYRGDN